MSAKPHRRDRWTPRLIYLYDLAWAAAAMIGWLIARYHFEPKPIPDGLLLRSTSVFVLICAVVFPIFRLQRGVWRYSGLHDLARIARAVVVANLLLLPTLFLLDRLVDFPRSSPLFIIPVLSAALFAGRALRRLFMQGDARSILRLEDRNQAPTIVVGAVPAVVAYLGGTLRGGRAAMRRARVAGVVSLDGGHDGRTIYGAEVLGGLPRLGDLLNALKAAEGRTPRVVLAEPRPSRALVKQVIAAAARSGAEVARIRGENGAVSLQPVQAADLLDRPPRVLDRTRLDSLIAGKRVLVTGAGGTIGSELTRQIIALAPAHVTLFDASEFNLYAIDQELRETGAPRVWRPVLGDVREMKALEAVFAADRPDVVLHAAALKHVPLMEQNPCETVLTNVMGAANIARLAMGRCEALVFISTDKAVNPTNVMGATKRVAERVVQALTAGGTLRTAVVRFGNVLGSTGSVVPLFERQIAAGGPITLTHPDVERYFMTVQEAASLVLQAAALPSVDDGAAGRIYVLDMGQPVKIEALARQLIALHGLEPDLDIEIVHTGLRPGEKLYEEIFYDAETVQPTGVDGVLAAIDARPSWEMLSTPLDALCAAAEARDEALTLHLLADLEPAFTRG